MKKNIMDNLKSWFLGNDLNKNVEKQPKEPVFQFDESLEPKNSFDISSLKVNIILYSDDKFGPSVVAVTHSEQFLKKYIMEHFGGIQMTYQNDGLAIEIGEENVNDGLQYWVVNEVGYPQNIIGSYWVSISDVEQ